MGFNATVIVMLDALHEIEKDPEFGKKLSDAILKVNSREQPQDISSGCHCNAATAIECHHADHSSLIAVGGNYATVILPYCGGYSHHEEKDKLNILQEFARQMGYDLHKKKNTNKEIADKLSCKVIVDLDDKH